MTEIIAVPTGAERVVTAHKFRPVMDSALKFKTMAEFCAEYVPLSYAVDPIMRSSSIYTLTAPTGAGKTAWLVIVSLAIATGRSDIVGFDVPAAGRVAYLAFENPDDVRMRLKIAAYKFNIDPGTVAERLVILDTRAKPEDVISNLAMMSQQQPFSIIVADTLAAFFDGKDINDNVQGGEFMRRLRPATLLPGRPTVLVAAHPVKNARDDQLVPYGGGAILNEVDGNLTLRNDAKIVTLHWQAKLRGLEFTPKPFLLEICDSPDLVDAKGRYVQLPVMRPVTKEDAEAAKKDDFDIGIALMRTILANPSGSQRTWAESLEKSPSTINRALQKLKVAKLVEPGLGDHWRLTPKGEKEIKDVTRVSS